MTVQRHLFVAGEGPTQRMIVALLEQIADGFTDAGCPLTTDQRAFLDSAITQAAPAG